MGSVDQHLSNVVKLYPSAMLIRGSGRPTDQLVDRTNLVRIVEYDGFRLLLLDRHKWPTMVFNSDIGEWVAMSGECPPHVGRYGLFLIHLEDDCKANLDGNDLHDEEAAISAFIRAERDLVGR